MPEGLMPCPFGCDHIADVELTQDGGPDKSSQEWVVSCGCCLARGPWADTRGVAVQLWNKRNSKHQRLDHERTGILIAEEKMLDVRLERAKQDAKWGEQNHNDWKWLTILVEEVGEVAKAMLECDGPEMGKEITQAAAVCVAWLEAIERRRG